MNRTLSANRLAAAPIVFHRSAQRQLGMLVVAAGWLWLLSHL
ncbi:hypothetical protein [uncultured Aquitalea sp.]|nr:hypothetical protein [uncultured Aquitalea sp.]